jgi:hypothetical protein
MFIIIVRASKKMNEIERKHELETRLEMYMMQKERIEQKESLSS